MRRSLVPWRSTTSRPILQTTSRVSLLRALRVSILWLLVMRPLLTMAATLHSPAAAQVSGSLSQLIILTRRSAAMLRRQPLRVVLTPLSSALRIVLRIRLSAAKSSTQTPSTPPPASKIVVRELSIRESLLTRRPLMILSLRSSMSAQPAQVPRSMARSTLTASTAPPLPLLRIQPSMWLPVMLMSWLMTTPIPPVSSARPLSHLRAQEWALALIVPSSIARP